MEHAIVLVLGDVGHSPRMNYHVLSIVNRGIPVEFVGYCESKVHSRLESNKLVSIVGIPPPPAVFNSFPSILCMVFKLLWLCVLLPFTLLFKTKFMTSFILVQNPPGVPTLLFAWIACKLKRAQLIIDWHNYSFSMIKYKYKLDQVKPKTYVKRVLRWFADSIAVWEGYFGRLATYNLCVSNMMREDLRRRWQVMAITLYDRSPAWSFQNINTEAQHLFFLKLLSHPDFAKHLISKNDLPGSTENTIFSYRNAEGKVVKRPDRPMFIVSSTSWTEDEDFGLFLDALKRFDSAPMPKRVGRNLPNLFVVITGKGPMKEYYVDCIQSMRWHHTTILTSWLTAEDYPKILACADLGICLHASTSGLDLPMKVVDMLGCCVPVLVKSFPAIGELVTKEFGGFFNTADDLNKELVDLSSGFPTETKRLNSMKAELQTNPRIDWEAQWTASMWPLIQAMDAAKADETRRQRRFIDNTPLN